ncbi:MAG: RluA family pseudouridine synthase [Clostridia bacterium]|nr:RluA family pseudouridine synthase [Clostridia bacterium]
MVIRHQVSQEEDGQLLQHILRGSMLISCSLLRKAKRIQGSILVNGEPRFTNQAVYTGETIVVTLPDYAFQEGHIPHRQESSRVKICFEDDTLLVVFKPPFLQTHPSPSSPRGSDTLEQRVQEYLGCAAHPVHRLDTETSGLVLFAKSPYIQSVLQQQMAAGQFRKRYCAVTAGVPPECSGIIDAPIERIAPDSFTRHISSQGKPAVTHYHLISKQQPPVCDSSIALLALSPETGRTHQLRVHLASLCCPILGDQRYGTPSSLAQSRQLGCSRLQLCATALSFPHPFKKQAVQITEPHDLDFFKDCH